MHFFSSFTILFPSPYFFRLRNCAEEIGEICDSKLVVSFFFPLEKFRMWMQIKTREYEFMLYLSNGAYIFV